MYQYRQESETQQECIIRIVDSAFIPFDESNSDYQQYLAWLAEGNEPAAAEL